jgi:hypothetical protein
MSGTVKLGQFHELELIVDAVRPNSSDSQQERNYNPRSRTGQIGIYNQIMEPVIEQNLHIPLAG